MDWKREAIRWRKAFWACIDDSNDERQKIKASKPKKTPKKKTTRKIKRKTKQLNLF